MAPNHNERHPTTPPRNENLITSRLYNSSHQWQEFNANNLRIDFSRRSAVVAPTSSRHTVPSSYRLVVPQILSHHPHPLLRYPTYPINVTLLPDPVTFIGGEADHHHRLRDFDTIALITMKQLTENLQPNVETLARRDFVANTTIPRNGRYIHDYFSLYMGLSRAKKAELAVLYDAYTAAASSPTNNAVLLCNPRLIFRLARRVLCAPAA